MLIVSIRAKDSRLLIGSNQPNIDELADQDLLEGKADDPSGEQNLKQLEGKVELMRLLYLLPYLMQQFLAPSGPGSHDDQIFQNKKNSIQLLKKSLPSIGINKKSEIFQKLEEIQRKTANQQYEQDEQHHEERPELKKEFEDLIKVTVNLIYAQGFKGSLMDCLKTFEILQKYQVDRFGNADKNKANDPNDQPIKIAALEMVIGYLKEILRDEDTQALLKNI